MGIVRRRARRRTALVVGGAARSGQKQERRRPGTGSGRGVPGRRPAGGSSRTTASRSDEWRYRPGPGLKGLGEARASGTLTDEEFEAEKAPILGS